MDDLESINKISGQIAEKDAQLATMFDDIIGDLMHENERNQDSFSRELGISGLSKIRLKNVVDQYSRINCINVIPGTQSRSCQDYCICFAFDKWQATKGFRGVIKSTIEYWLSCFKMNRGTLIFTYSWDGVDFNEKCKKSFDNYTKDSQHTVAVILISSIGVSLQYLNS